MRRRRVHTMDAIGLLTSGKQADRRSRLVVGMLLRFHEQELNEAVQAGCSKQSTQRGVQEYLPGYSVGGFGISQSMEKLHGFRSPFMTYDFPSRI